MMIMKYFLSCVFFNAFVIFMNTGCSQAGFSGSGMKGPKTRRNFTMRKGMLTHHGKKFVLGFINPTYSQEKAGKFEIFIQALANDTVVRVHMPYTTWDKTYVLTKKQVTKVEIPKQLLLAGKTKVENKGVGITADKDITVYAFNRARHAKGDAFVVHPKRSLGQVYVVTTYGGSHSNIGIIGVRNNTNVSIVLNGRARITHNHRVYTNGETIRVSLDELHTFHIRSRFDLSGVRIIASKPVAVLSAASCELSKFSRNCGFVIDQLPPVKRWGNEYVVYTEQRNSTQGGLVRVTSARDNTVVRLENGVTTHMGIGGVMDLVVKPRWPTRISCTPFCMATLYTTHLSLNNRHIGPSAVILPATNHFQAYYSVYIPKEGQELAFLNILMKCSAIDGLLMNGVLLKNLIWQASESKTWCGVTIKIAKSGVNTLQHQTGIGFSVLVSGIGDQYSYSYFGEGFQVTRNEIGLQKNTEPTNAVRLEKIIRLQNASEPKVYKYATAGLSALCALTLLSLAVYLLRNKYTKDACEKDEDMSTKIPPDDRTYQSIRGFERRNTHSYETVKLPLRRSTHPAIADVLLLADEKGQDYENLEFHQKERDCNPYVPMDEALSASVKVEQLCAMTGESDIYLTMKRLIKEPEETEEITEAAKEDNFL